MTWKLSALAFVGAVCLHRYIKYRQAQAPKKLMLSDAMARVNKLALERKAEIDEERRRRECLAAERWVS